IARYEIAAGRLGLEAGAQFTKYGELRLGLVRQENKVSLDTGPEFLRPPRDRTSYTLVTLRGLVDQVDNVNFPRSGYAATMNLVSSSRSLGSDMNFARGDLDANYVVSFGRHTLSVGIKVGGPLGNNELPADAFFQWGGLLQQSGYPTGALLGQDIRFARL